jgi:alanyl-tRNA synthetase
VEKQVNEKVKADAPVKWEERAFTEVKGDPTVLQFFGDKYGTTVRVVDIGGFSKELCGGTHVRSCGKIGAVRVVGESAIAAGVRRIEAVSGPALAEWCAEEMRKQQEKWEGLAKRKAGIVPLSRESGTISPEQAWDLVKKREKELAQTEEAIREEEEKERDRRDRNMQNRKEINDLNEKNKELRER